MNQKPKVPVKVATPRLFSWIGSGSELAHLTRRVLEAFGFEFCTKNPERRTEAQLCILDRDFKILEFNEFNFYSLRSWVDVFIGCCPTHP